MKARKFLSVLLVLTMSLSFAACGKVKVNVNSEVKTQSEAQSEIVIDPVRELINEEGKKTHIADNYFRFSKDDEEPVICSCYVAASLPVTMKDLPLVSGIKNNIYCPVILDSQYASVKLKAYIFDQSDEYRWDKDDAYAVFESTIYDDYKENFGGDIFAVVKGCKAYRFTGELPENMKHGVYTIVFVDQNDKVRGMNEVDLVESVEERDERELSRLVEKPVIYLYPEEETNVEVGLDLDYELACTYPRYNNGWRVIATPDGKITNEDGREYDYLFWEGNTNMVFGNFDKAICVRGEDTCAFLEKYLELSGLNSSEVDDFISFWLPRMECNEYNLISFPTEEYAKHSRLDVSPAPQTEIRVYMVFKALPDEIEIPAGHELQMPEQKVREGFSVVEWGGSEIR